MDAALREKWLEHLTASAIGRALGLTKNQVIGRAHRLNLPKRPAPNKVRTPGGRGRKIEPVRYLSGSGLPSGCAFIAGDPTSEIRAGRDPHCGAERQLGSPYCAHHHAVCYHKKPAVSLDTHAPKSFAEPGFGKGRTAA